MKSRLSAAQRRLLLAIASGQTLKAHRDIEGHKAFRLHPADGAEPVPIPWRTATALYARGYIDSNKKFPAATFWLTDKGRAALSEIPAHGPGPAPPSSPASDEADRPREHA